MDLGDLETEYIDEPLQLPVPGHEPAAEPDQTTPVEAPDEELVPA